MWKNCGVVLLIIFSSLNLAAESNRHSHYVFTLPDGYVGWIQVIFNDTDAPPLSVKNGGYLIEVPESRVTRNSALRVHDFKRTDKFYYRFLLPSGSIELRSLPSEYVMLGDSHGGFGVMDTGGKGRGYSWFIFIGPSELRAKVPLADWDKVVDDYQKTHDGKKRIEFSGPYPTPGRMKQ
jgi:hypothetical protein